MTADNVNRRLTNRYLQPVDPNLQASVRGDGERRIVTILFCDVADSTAMAERFDPEDWADIMSEAFDYLIEPIERYEGTIFRLMGDAILAIFGAPQAHEDDPHRAILAGLEILENVQHLREQLRRGFGIEFNVRIGINTGLVVVGTYGSGTTVEYTAMGNAINVASKLEQSAVPGTIVVGETTYRLSASLFEFQLLGSIDVHDAQEPEQMFRVLNRKPVTDGSRNPNSRRMPFINRIAEMAKLCRAIEELRHQGRGRVIFLIGDPGVGKSRIIEELHGYVMSQGEEGMAVAWLENRISSYETSQPYGALRQRLRRVFDIQRDDPPEAVREKVLLRATQFPASFRQRAARVVERVLATDLAAASSESGGLDFEPDEFKEELFIVMRALFRGWSPDGAIIFVSEDNHRADAPSFELLSHLFPVVADHPAVLISTLRPERESAIWQKRDEIAAALGDSYLEIWIEPLVERCARDLMDAMIGGSQVGSDLLETILARAEGNPLFIEEILQWLADRGYLRRLSDDSAYSQVVEGSDLMDNSIPTSLQALLLERIDRLPADSRRVLQQAAVIGRIFSESVLRESMQGDQKLSDYLHTLIDLDLIREIGNSDSDEFAFRSALIRDVAYNTILHRQLRDFHRCVGEAMETVYREESEEYAGQIGRHYYEAADPRAVAWLLKAAEQAEILFEPKMVIDNTSMAIDLAERINQQPESRAYELRARAFELLKSHEAALRDYEYLRALTSSEASPT